MKTEDLIQRLGTELTPVRPLAAPWRRAVGWLACGGVYVMAVVLWTWMRRGSLPGTTGDVLYVVQQLALGATVITAAVAAFVSVIPGADRRGLWLPIVPALLVIATLVWGCIADLRVQGTLGIGRETDWPCVRSIVLGGLILGGIAVSMLRRGAPLAPGVSSLLAGAAALGLANVEACVTRPHAFSSTVLLWHGVTTALVAAALVRLGRSLLTWRRLGRGLPT